jgi:pimeloyl-ACP methyl ester carboxylesterase
MKGNASGSLDDVERMRPLVLVPGAWLGGWAWHEVLARLQALGHEDLHPVTLTGMGERAQRASRRVDLETHIADVVDLLDTEDLEDVVLVGHSYGGVVVTGVADRRPERLDALVYVDTRPLPSGTAVVDVQPPELRARQEADVRERGDGWRWPLVDRETLASGAFGSAAGLQEHHFELLERRATAQPYATLTSPLVLAHDRPPGVRRVGVLCTGSGVDLALLRALAEQGDPRAAVFADEDWELHELPTGHWPMFTMPDALADLLHEVASAPAGIRSG